MDDELKQLEAELTRLKPAAPSHDLTARIERELEATPEHHSRASIRWLWVAVLPVAAAVAITVMQFSPRSKSASDPVAAGNPSVQRPLGVVAVSGEVSLKPVAAENVLVSATDEGLVTLDDGTQARRARLHYVDTITWKNPRTNASLTWSVPREEVRVVPIAFQ